MDYERTQALANVITDQEYEKYKNHFFWLARNMQPEGITFIKHLKKLPNPEHPGEFLYEYELSDFYRTFLLFMENEFKGKNQDLKSAIMMKIINDLNLSA